VTTHTTPRSEREASAAGQRFDIVCLARSPQESDALLELIRYSFDDELGVPETRGCPSGAASLSRLVVEVAT